MVIKRKAKMKKNTLLIFIMLIGTLFLMGCEKNNLSIYAGSYKLEYFKYVGDPENVKDNSIDEELILNKNGTGIISRDNERYELTWNVDDNKIELLLKDNSIYKGTISADKIDIFNGDANDDLTIEYVYTKQ